MKVTLLGTGTSLPDPNRVQSGAMIEDNSGFTLFDIGSGTLHRLTQTGIDLTQIQGVFISHFHIDHWSDLVPLIQTIWLLDYKKELAIYMPSTGRDWFRGLFEVTIPFYRDKVILRPHFLAEKDAVQCGELSVSTCSTVHSVHDVRAFKIEHEGKSVVISSDTSLCREVIELASEVDILIHECNWLDGPHPNGIHTTPSELMQVVEEAKPKKVILTHMSPEVVESEDKVISIVGRRTDAEVVIGKDLMTIEL